MSGDLERAATTVAGATAVGNPEAYHGWFHVDFDDLVTWSLERPAEEEVTAADMIWPATLTATHAEFLAACEALAEKRAEVERQDAEIVGLKREVARLREGLRPFARFFKSERHDLSAAADATIVASFLGRDGLPLGELWMSDLRQAHHLVEAKGAGDVR